MRCPAGSIRRDTVIRPQVLLMVPDCSDTISSSSLKHWYETGWIHDILFLLKWDHLNIPAETVWSDECSTVPSDCVEPTWTCFRFLFWLEGHLVCCCSRVQCVACSELFHPDWNQQFPESLLPFTQLIPVWPLTSTDLLLTGHLQTSLSKRLSSGEPRRVHMLPRDWPAAIENKMSLLFIVTQPDFKVETQVIKCENMSANIPKLSEEHTQVHQELSLFSHWLILKCEIVTIWQMLDFLFFFVWRNTAS